ncbi:hypothetical protein DMH04_16175 [Kibdelosporangium aridum]|uniref:Tetracyclin repressor-like C-terminal domain-containing protein n=1 Tax=Kibdelosporangium aridum TaxID=2030 RepID=A0A428ZCG7_KIBAR|nr:hypothetical protein [Kibdelosporangium aridum]RSM85736.1 hypothetical protein DMH04_16175 [Kibdelosporangium aridum]
MTLEKTLHTLLLRHIEVTEEHSFVFTEHLIATDPGLVRRSDELEEREIALFAACQEAGILRADLPARWISGVVYGLLMAGREGLRRGDIARRELPRLLSETFFRGMSR